MHPLKRAYNTYIHRHYGAFDGREDDARTEIIAQRVHRLGLNYDQFAEVGCSLWHSWSERREWKYPYWNAVTSDASFERIEKFLSYAQVLGNKTTEFQDEILYEQAYILDYIDWWLGRRETKPTHDLPVSGKAAIEATEMVCELYGITFVSTNVNRIASQVEDLHGSNS